MNVSDWRDISNYYKLTTTHALFWRVPDQTPTASCHIYCRVAHRRHVRVQRLVRTEYRRALMIQGGSNMTGTDLCVNKCKQSRSNLNHLVHPCTSVDIPNSDPPLVTAIAPYYNMDRCYNMEILRGRNVWGRLNLWSWKWTFK